MNTWKVGDKFTWLTGSGDVQKNRPDWIIVIAERNPSTNAFDYTKDCRCALICTNNGDRFINDNILVKDTTKITLRELYELFGGEKYSMNFVGPNYQPIHSTITMGNGVRFKFTDTKVIVENLGYQIKVVPQSEFTDLVNWYRNPRVTFLGYRLSKHTDGTLSIGAKTFLKDEMDELIKEYESQLKVSKD